MVDTFIGRRYARAIRRGAIGIEDVETPFYNDVLDSYMEVFGTPLDVTASEVISWTQPSLCVSWTAVFWCSS